MDHQMNYNPVLKCRTNIRIIWNHRTLAKQRDIWKFKDESLDSKISSHHDLFKDLFSF